MDADEAKVEAKDETEDEAKHVAKVEANSFLSTLRVIAHSDHVRSPRTVGGGKAAVTAHTAHANILDQSKLFGSDDEDDDDDSFADDAEVEETAKTEEKADAAEARRSRESSPVHRSRDSSPARRSGRGRGSSPVRRSRTKGSRSSSPARRSKTRDDAPGGALTEHLSRSGSPDSHHHRRGTGVAVVDSGRERSHHHARHSGRDRSKSPVRHEGRLRDAGRLRKSGKSGSPGGSPRERTTRTTRQRSPMRHSEGATTTGGARTRSPQRTSTDHNSGLHRSGHTRGSPPSSPKRMHHSSHHSSTVKSATISKIYAESANVQKARREAYIKLCEQDGVEEDLLAGSSHQTKQAFSRREAYSPGRAHGSRETSPTTRPDALRASQGVNSSQKHIMGVKPSDDPLATDYDRVIEATVGFKPKNECWDMMKGGLNI